MSYLHEIIWNVRRQSNGAKNMCTQETHLLFLTLLTKRNHTACSTFNLNDPCLKLHSRYLLLWTCKAIAVMDKEGIIKSILCWDWERPDHKICCEQQDVVMRYKIVALPLPTSRQPQIMEKSVHYKHSASVDTVELQWAKFVSTSRKNYFLIFCSTFLIGRVGTGCDWPHGSSERLHKRIQYIQ